MCERVCLSLLSFIQVQHICVSLCRVSMTGHGLMPGYVNVLFERIFKEEACQKIQGPHVRPDRTLFEMTCLSLDPACHSASCCLYLACIFLSLFSTFAFQCFLFFLTSSTFFPPSASSSLSSSQDMSLLTSSDRKYKHTYQLRCFLSISLSHLENLSLPPKHDNTEKAMKGRYGLH